MILEYLSFLLKMRMTATRETNMKTLKIGSCVFKIHTMYVVQVIQNIMVATISMKSVMIQIGMIVSGMILDVMKNHKMNTREVLRAATWTVTLMPFAIQWVQNQKRWINSSFS